VAANMEPIPGAPFMGETNSSHLWIFDKADVYAGGLGRFTLIQFTETQFQGFEMMPASTFDPDLTVLHVLKLVPNPAGPWTDFPPGLRVHQIDGPVGSETLRLLSFVPAPRSWPIGRGQYAGPQLGSPLQALIIEKALGNVVYRNGSLWTTHHSFLTAGTDR